MLDKFTTLLSVFLRRNLVINFSAIETCNARCTMCNVWKSNQGFSFQPGNMADFDKTIKTFTKHIGISGGEPFLRPDLIDLVSAALTNFPSLKSLSITSHGFQEQRIRSQLHDIQLLCEAKKVSFSLNLSIDGDQKSHDQQRGVPGGYDKVLRSAVYANSLRVPIQFQFTATSENVYTAPHVLFLAEQMDASIVFRVATNITRLGQKDRDIVGLHASERSYFSDFLLSEKVMDVSSLSRRIYYRALSKYLLRGEKFNRFCLFKQNGLYVDGNKNAYPCSLATQALGKIESQAIEKLTSTKIRKQLVINKCPDCIHDQSFIPSPKEYITEIFFKYAPRAMSKRLIFLTNIFFNSIKSSFQNTKIQKGSVLVIGQYGGEHVGDSAILGGVLQSLPVSSTVDIASIRPDRTKFWLTGLVNIRQKVRVLSISEAFQNIRRYERIVFGGGPIMWLPTILLYHYALVLLSSRQSIIEINGCGIIESRSKIFKIIVKQILRRAQKIEFRSSYSMIFCEEHRITGAKLIEDPAITYMLTNYEKK